MKTKKCDKPIPIIEYMENRQRTPEEVLDHLQHEENVKEITQIFVWYEKEDGHAYYIPGSNNRQFTNSEIYWSLSKLLFHFMKNI